MKNQLCNQATALFSLVLATLAGYAVAASPKSTGHISKGYPAASRSHHKAVLAVKRSRISKSAATKLYGKIQHSAAAGASPGNFTSPQRQDDREMMRNESSSIDLAKDGDADARLNNWSRAAASYQDALSLWPDNLEALYGLGQSAAAAGDLPRALRYYRTAVYVPAPNTLNVYGTVPGDGFQTNDVKRLMQFALLLNRAGQLQEAVFIYNRAAALMDYERGDAQHGQQVVKVLLPELVAEPATPSQVQYTPQRLQALADTALADKEMSFGSNKEAIAHMKEAVKMYPDSAAVQYYLGEALSGSYYVYLDSPVKDKPAAWAAYQEDKKAVAPSYKKAEELGDDKTAMAAKERLDVLR